jgi:hypothetical protein
MKFKLDETLLEDEFREMDREKYPILGPIRRCSTFVHVGGGRCAVQGVWLTYHCDFSIQPFARPWNNPSLGMRNIQGSNLGKICTDYIEWQRQAKR